MIVIVGSRELELTPDIVTTVTAAISAETPGHPVAVRTPLNQSLATSPVEALAEVLAPKMGRDVWHAMPTSAAGRAGVYRRDYTMVEQACRVVAFFAPEREMEGGTGHIVKAALDRGIPVEAYGLTEEGDLELIGSDEGDEWRQQSAPFVLNRLYAEAPNEE